MTSPTETHPATRKEEALWLLETMVPGTSANHLSLAFRVEGPLRADALERALIRLTGRHRALRTVYRATDTELRRSVLPPGQFRLPVGDIPAATGDAIRDLEAFVAQPLPLDGTPPLRAGVLRGADGDTFCLVVHHLVFDTASATILRDELVTLYEAALAGRDLDAELTEPAAEFTEPEPSEAHLAYWHRQLAGFDRQSLELSYGRPDGPTPDLDGEQLTRDLSPEIRAAVRQAQKDLRAPEAVILLSAFALLLDGHGAGPDLVVGSPVNVRPPAAERAVGYHINVVPLRLRVDPTLTLAELVRATRDTFLDGLAHSGVPVDDLGDVAPSAATTWRNPLFRHVFNYVPTVGDPRFTLAGTPATLLAVENGCSKFDLEFFVMPSDEGIRLRAAYRTENFDATEVAALLERYEALLAGLLDHAATPVAEIPLLGPTDRAVIDAANATRAATDPATVPAAIHARALATPGATAVVDGDRAAGYRALWLAAQDVRDALRAAGLAPGEVVAVVAPRGVELVAAVLGTWLAGGVYMPIDPDHPAQRIAYQLADSAAPVVLAPPERAELAGEGRVLVPLRAPREDRDEPLDAPPTTADAPAYLMYTSGSTGRPKGTLVGHAALANLTAHFARELDATPDDAGLWLTTFSFDISGLELYVPLWAGGRVVVAPDAARLDGAVLRELLERHDVGIVEATPTTWRAVLDAAGPALAGRRVLCGGEPLPAPLAERLIATGCRLHHVYGPTETTIWSTSAVLTKVEGGRVPVGRPISNTVVLVRDEAGRELPLGVRGELCVAGDGVAFGYHDRPELTAERFPTHPVHGRFYRTGDVAFWRRDGALELLGRGDRQVKLRGNRIELGEIESVLSRHPEVKTAAVVLVDAGGPDAALVAFIEGVGGPELTDSVWEHARGELPRAVVPQEFVIADALPTTLNDKVDYPALLRLAEERRAAAAAPNATDPADPAGGDPLVAQLIGLWAELLERGDITPDTNFFAHGGHSLMGAILVQRLEPLTGVSLPLAELFADPTPRRLAARLRAAGAQDSAPGAGTE
ncbi:non-ribosomal peptide synthetase [Streptomyces triticirhizae]|nr:non-ribosomal peptide synthetase [Streptomyces triticirhizae]